MDDITARHEHGDSRPNMHEYFMNIAIAVRKRANCKGQRVGALITRENRILATGYNGTPQAMRNCLDGGCFRCDNRDARFPSGTAYDLCICVHAEQNALLSAARFGTPVAGGTLYTTTRPCFGCTKEMLQASISEVWFIHDWTHPDDEYMNQYELIQARFPGGIRQMDVLDGEETWARAGRTTPGDTGHRSPV